MGGTSAPQKTQQIRLSRPSRPHNPPNPQPINHFPPKNSWHSSYAPRRIIKSVSKTTQTRPTSRAFAFSRLRKNSPSCLSEGAGGISPLNKADGCRGLEPRALHLKRQSTLFRSRIAGRSHSNKLIPETLLNKHLGIKTLIAKSRLNQTRSRPSPDLTCFF